MPPKKEKKVKEKGITADNVSRVGEKLAQILQANPEAPIQDALRSAYENSKI